MGDGYYEYKVQFRHFGDSDWNDVVARPAITDIIDARALKRRCERTYGTSKHMVYRIVQRPKNWEPCE